jgi:putative hydrolase of the HAD superfamily
MDNTVLAFDQAVEQSWAEVAQAYAPKLEGITSERLLEALLRSRDRFWADPVRNHWGRNNLAEALRQSVGNALAELGCRQDALVEAMAHDNVSIFDQLIAPFPGALETLERLRQQGVRLALVSNGGAEVQRRKINKFKLDALVDAVLIEGELGFGKPDARIFRQALERLGATPAKAWMVGDNLEHDIAPAQALGMTGIWVDWQGRGLPSGSAVRPDRVVRGLGELLS